MENKQPTKLDSKIISVTVYGDRAQVTRAAEAELAKGEHTLVFGGLPADIERNSVQVNGKGKAVLRDVKFIVKQYNETPVANSKELLDRKQKIEDDLDILNDTAEEAQKEIAFLEDLEKRAVRPTRDKGDEMDPSKWEQLTNFYRKKLSVLNGELRGLEIQRREKQKELDRVLREIQNAGSGNVKQDHTIEVKVEMQEAGKLVLTAAYIVYGPSWRPVYDLRVSSDEKKMNISYNALVRQCTGEDWNDIQLKLSTAQAQVGGKQPELEAWHLYIEEPQVYSKAIPASAPMRSAAFGAGAEKKKDMNSQMFEAEDAADESLSAPEAPDMEIGGTAVETGTTSVVFAVSGGSTVKSDNQDHRSTILIFDFPAKFRYSAAPKLSPYAYLKAQVTNTTDYPFLPGETNIFLDSNFVSSSSLELVAPSEEFWTFLGIDESVKVEHKILKKYHKEGLIGKKDTLVYEFLIKVTNNKKTEEEMVVWDQLPISNDQNIVVKIIEPQYKENTDSLKKNEENFLEWFFKMKPGEKKEIPLKFSVEYPRDSRIAGL
jgi:uncharacterized protein (TIGR02231 family)